jgi:PAS domain S-box-containing protein
MRTSIPGIIGVLAAVMIATFALWEGVEALLFTDAPPFPLSLFYLIRGVSTGIVMAALTAWLMLRYRSGFEERLRRQSEEAQRMRVFFENIVQDAGEAIISLDTRGIIRTWNRSAEAIYGYSAEEMVGQPLQRLIPPDLRQAGELRALEERLARHGCIRNYETRRLRKDGAVLDVRITRSLLRDAGGSVIGSSAIVSDVSQEKAMESRLIQAEKLAAVGQTAASIAHEVRNALAGISGTVQVLKGHASWRDLPEGVGEEVDLQVGRIAHIVNDLLTYARPGTVRPERADLRRLLDRVLTVSAGAPEAAGKRVQRDYGDSPILADVDPAWIEQAFTNVVTNAYQAMGPGGSLRVMTRARNASVEIAFADDGCGMPDKVAARAFEPFFTTKVRGTGLGLPIVRSIIEAHHGTVRLHSEPAHGTTVVLTLPSAAGSTT